MCKHVCCYTSWEILAEVKFIYSEKPQHFVAFSEYMNFKGKQRRAKPKVFKKIHRPHEEIKNVRTRVLASFRRRMGFLLNVKKALKWQFPIVSPLHTRIFLVRLLNIRKPECFYHNSIFILSYCWVQLLTLKATHLATQFFRAYKISHPQIKWAF